MAKKAILIGAGKIGRGFIGEVLHRAGYDLTFVDTSKELVDMINKYKKYKIILLGANETSLTVENVKAYTTNDENAINEGINADIITTAVGPSVLYTTANYIADIIKKRYKNNITKPLTIIACENMKYASTSLYDNVKLLLTSTELTYCQEMVAFPDAEVSRMAMPIIDENPLTVKVEEYKEWIIDKKNLKSDLSDIKDLELTDNPAAFINRKIYTLTGHAMVGYLGFQKGYTYIYEAAYDDEIFKKVTGALMESGRGWAREYGMLEEDFFEYSSVMLRRFADIRLKDPIHRVCREPLRKLSPRERFIQPAITAIKYGILPYSIIDGIKSVFEYKNNDDEQTVSMCKIIKNMGKGEILTDICGLERESVLYNLIIN